MVTGINRNRPYVNIALAAVNALVFLYLEAIGSTEDGVFMVKHGAVFAPFVILGGEYYRLFTAMFLHFGVSHLANNMLVLLVLGEKMEKALGHIKYLIFYLASGVAANGISLAVQVRTGAASVSAGASGAIFGVVGGLVYVIAIHHGQLDGLTNRQLGFMVLLTLYHGVYFNRSGQCSSHRRPDFRLHFRHPALQEETCCQNFRYGWIECRLC